MSENERARVAAEIAVRLRRDGIRLTGREGGEELVRILEAVERFENAVMRAGGDRMVDEAVRGRTPTEPDNRAFVLPDREATETVDAFIERIDAATARASTQRR